MPLTEPFRIRTVEPIAFPSRDDRLAALAAAGHNPFRMRSDKVTIDLLSDSGTGATSVYQESAAMCAREDYAGSPAWWHLHDTLTDLTGFPHILPAHQGRGAEHVVFGAMLKPGNICLSNTHFDTTTANIERLGAQARNLPCPEAADLDSDYPFKGDIDLDALRATLEGPDGPRVRLVLITITSNGGGGQPVSMANLRAARELCRQHDVPLFLDAARFAENAWLVCQREPGYNQYTPREVARQAFDLADGALFSLKKDGIGHAGGCFGVRDADLANRCRNDVIVTEGGENYGGMSGRTMEQLAVGLTEVTDPAYLAYRASHTAYLADLAAQAGIDSVRPTGVHAVYLNAGRLLSHLPASRFPGHALGCALYVEGGIRCAELGSLYLGTLDATNELVIAAPFELVRLALPRRVYTQSHLEYVADVLAGIAGKPETLTGYRVTYTPPPPTPRHFTGRFAPVEETP